ncbi:SDR family NAD(P)-dependent oxidoreductase [Aurantimonas sp. C2-3-R2]|uniref:SDR family NAD(P)-dependent oxidoreductase n=1 Tax=unclassified Aurantimonas TaxID=2638230 RepID=UPI003FA41C1B
MKTIVVTGANSGIGRTATERFLDDGWRVGMIARRKDRLDSIAETPEFAIPRACDVTTGRVLHRRGRPKRRRSWPHMGRLRSRGSRQVDIGESPIHS